MKKKVLFFAIAAMLVAGAWYANTPATPKKMSGAMGEVLVFTVLKGEATSSIVRRLKEEGYIHSKLLFRFALSRSGLAGQLQPGAHDLTGVRSYSDVIVRLATWVLGPEEARITVREGWNLHDIKAEAMRLGVTDADGFFGLAGEPGVDYRVGPQNDDWPVRAYKRAPNRPVILDAVPDWTTLEGFLFPDTYRVNKIGGTSQLIGKMLENFDRKLVPDLRAEIGRQGKTVFDVVTMASIIEREVRDDPDRAIVADIFWRRLDAGMPLQADSTVNYVTGKGIASVTSDDTKIDSRYNTYKYRGLPFGPISNPGLASFAAAIRPQANQYWYFLTDATGTVHYAKTLDEHNRNKAKYLR